MVGLSSQGHNNNCLYHLYHPTKIVEVVVVVVTTLIGGAMIFIIVQIQFMWQSSMHMLWLPLFVEDIQKVNFLRVYNLAW